MGTSWRRCLPGTVRSCSFHSLQVAAYHGYKDVFGYYDDMSAVAFDDRGPPIPPTCPESANEDFAIEASSPAATAAAAATATAAGRVGVTLGSGSSCGGDQKGLKGLGCVRAPLLVVHALDDPIIHGDSVRSGSETGYFFYACRRRRRRMVLISRFCDLPAFASFCFSLFPFHPFHPSSSSSSSSSFLFSSSLFSSSLFSSYRRCPSAVRWRPARRPFASSRRAGATSAGRRGGSRGATAGAGPTPSRLTSSRPCTAAMPTGRVTTAAAQWAAARRPREDRESNQRQRCPAERPRERRIEDHAEF